MPITDAERAAIKKRAQELLAAPNPPSMGAAAQQAYAEIVKPQRTKVEKTAEAADVELQKRAVTDYGVTRSKFVSQKTAEYEKAGYNQLEADTMAQDEWDRNYGAPQIGPYDETYKPLGSKALAPKAAPPVSSDVEPATIGKALSPQTYIPESGAKAEKERATKPNLAGAPGGLRVNYAGIIKSLEDSGLTHEEALAQAQSFQAAYGQNLVDIATGYKNSGKVAPAGDVLAKEAFDATMKDIQDLPDALSNKEKWTKDVLKRGGPNDPYYLAFSKQIEVGEGVPTLTKAQGAYVKRAAELERKATYERLKKEYEGKPIIVPDPTASDVRGGTKRMVELSAGERENWLQAKAAGEVQTPWWTNPAEVKRRQLDPERGVEGGMFSTTTSLGSKQEANTAWLLRSGMSPLNAVAGWAFPKAFTGHGEGSEAIEAERRRLRPEAYKDSPILLNMAQGRGFVGEASEVSDILGLDKDAIIGPVTLGTVYKGGAFAADMLDPTLDIVGAGAKGGTAAYEAYKLGKELGAGIKGKSLAGFGAKVAGEELMRESALAQGISTLTPNKLKPKVMLGGDVRLFVAERLQAEAEAAAGIRPMAGTKLESEISRTGSLQNALDNSPIIKNAVDEVEGLRNSINGTGKEISYESLKNAYNEAYAIKPREYATGASYDEMIAHLRANPNLQKDLERSIIRQNLRGGVYEATKDTLLHSGIIALTPNTFITANKFDEIARDWKKSPLYKDLYDLRTTKGSGRAAQVNPIVQSFPDWMKKQAASVVYSPIEGTHPLSSLEVAKLTPVEGFETNDEKLFTSLASKWSEARDVGLTSLKNNFRVVKNADGSFKAGFIPLQDVRTLTNIGLDEIAMTKSGYASSKDVERLTPLVGKETTKPIELRDLGFANWKRWSQDSIKKPSTPLSRGQEAFVNEVSNTLTGLDRRLRSDMSRMVNDPNFREAYGITLTDRPTRKELLGYLTLGPIQDKKLTEDTLMSMANQTITTKRYQPSIFDNIDGIDRMKYDSVWSSTGNLKLRAAAKKGADAVMASPKLWESEVNNIIDTARQLAKNDDNIIVGSDEIIDGLKGKPAPNEMLVAGYYTAESRRIYNDVLKTMVDKSGRQASFSQIERTAPAELANILSTEDYGKPIANLIDHMINNDNLSRMSTSDIIDAIEPDKFVRDELIRTGLQERYLNIVRNEADFVMKNNGLVARDNGLDNLLDAVEKAYSDNDATGLAKLKLSLGEKTTAELLNRLDQGGIKQLEKNLREAMTEPGIRPTTKKVINNIIDFTKSVFYTAILTAAPRFHGNNMLGAPIIIYSTTGKIIDPADIMDSISVMAKADLPLAGSQFLLDKYGRSYSINEIWRAFSEGAAKSNWEVRMPSVDSIMMNAIADEGAGARALGAYDWFLQLPNNEDLMWRMAVGIRALKEGRPMDDAIKLAREALFDNGNITPYEKQVQNWTLFYNFNRNNLINLISNLTSPKGIKRVVNSAKLKRGIENVMGVPEQVKQYAPSSTATRAILGTGGDYGDKQTVIVAPSDPQLQAFELLANLIAFNPETVTSMLRPGLKEVGQEVRETEQVPPEQVAWFKGLSEILKAGGVPNSEVEDLISIVAGEKVEAYKSDAPEAVDGYVYPLLTQQQRDRYTFVLNSLGYFGLSRLISDVPQMFGAQGTKTAAAYEGPLGLASFGVGMTTPLKMMTPEQQRLKQVLAQTAEGRKMISDIDDAVTSELKAVNAPLVTPKEARYAAKKEKMDKKIAAKYDKLSDFKKEKLRIRSEYMTIKSQMRSDPGNIDVYKQKMQRLKQDAKALKDAERAAQAANKKK